MTEIFKTIKGYDGKYQISNLGRVKSLARKGVKRDRILKASIASDGYPGVAVFINSKAFRLSIHRLLGEYFIPNPENKKTINHKNGIKTDYRLVNLEWSTQLENNLHALSTGLRPSSRRSLSDKDALFVFNSLKNTSELKAMFNVSRNVIRRIKLGLTYKNVTQS